MKPTLSLCNIQKKRKQMGIDRIKGDTRNLIYMLLGLGNIYSIPSNSNYKAHLM